MKAEGGLSRVSLGHPLRWLELPIRPSARSALAEAAEDFGWRNETVRNYSKKIYAKTGRGRSEPVRTILTSGLAFAW